MVKKAFAIKDWAGHFENASSVRIKKTNYVLLPNRHDGVGYSRIAKCEDCVEIFAAWCLILQVASRMQTRGVLVCDGEPLTSEDMADLTRFPESIFKKAFDVLSSDRIGWITEIDVSETTTFVLETDTVVPQTAIVVTETDANVSEQTSVIHKTIHNVDKRPIQNRTEQNRTEQNIHRERTVVGESGPEVSDLSIRTCAREIFKIYPKKEGEKAALVEIENIIRSGTPSEILYEKTQFYAKMLKELKVNPESPDWRYVPHAIKWFGDRRFKLSWDEWAAPFSEKKTTHTIKAQIEAVERDIANLPSIYYVHPQSTPDEIKERDDTLARKKELKSKLEKLWGELSKT